MYLELNEDQRMLAESARTWLGKEYGHAVWREIAFSAAGASAHVWAQFAEMGWLAAALPEAQGGLGGGAMESGVLGEAFGSALVLEPYLSSVVVGAGLIAQAGSAAQVAEYLPRIAAGKLKIAFACAEAGARFCMNDVGTRAEKRNGAYAITGRKITVWDAPGADLIVVLARTAGGRRDARGLGLFVVDAGAPGLKLEPFAMIDHRPGAHLSFDAVPVQAVLGDAEAALPAVERVADGALAYLAAEACGAMHAATAQTVEYLKQRKQFGQALAEFQVLRHRVVDMTVQFECTRSLALNAAACADSEGPQRALAAAAAKVQAGRAGRWVGHQAVQLHGGMGMTDELFVGQFMKRLVMIDTAFGNADHHQQRFAAMSRAATVQA